MFHVKHFVKTRCIRAIFFVARFFVSKKSAYYLHLNRKERRKNMYKINPPKIHLSTVLGYDVEGKRYIVKDEKIFDTEREL